MLSNPLSGRTDVSSTRNREVTSTITTQRPSADQALALSTLRTCNVHDCVKQWTAQPVSGQPATRGDYVVVPFWSEANCFQLFSANQTRVLHPRHLQSLVLEPVRSSRCQSSGVPICFLFTPEPSPSTAHATSPSWSFRFYLLCCRCEASSCHRHTRMGRLHTSVSCPPGVAASDATLTPWSHTI